MFIIKTPPSYKYERKYIIQILLGDLLGIAFHVESHNSQHTSIADKNGKELIVNDTFFQTPHNQWLTLESLPKQPLRVWNTREVNIDCTLVDPKIPIIFGQTQPFNFTESNILPIDIFGSSFFMLTRYEEVVTLCKDEHGRFPARASLAYQENFLNRPIINEYLEILWWYLKKLWPELERKKRKFRIIPTHDVDRPFKYIHKNIPNLFFSCLIGASKQRSFTMAYRPVIEWLNAYSGKSYNDPYNTYNWIMDISESSGLTSIFYFFGEKAGNRFDGNYDINNQNIIKLLQKIKNRNHKIGFHGSYNSYMNENRLRHEFKTVKRTCFNKKITNKICESRQHYLRWQITDTPIILDKLGIAYDSTLVFADLPGYRCGCCFEYPLFDFYNHCALKLKERPLIIMESTFLDSYYMKLNIEDTYNLIMKLKLQCKKFYGDFTILWHNNWLIDEVIKDLYKSILTE